MRNTFLPIPSYLAAEPHDCTLQTNYLKNRKHRWADSDAGEQCAGAVHDDAEFCAFFFGESFNSGFDVFLDVGPIGEL